MAEGLHLRRASSTAVHDEHRPAARAAERQAQVRRPVQKAGVRQIKIHDTRRTCGSLLAALDVHPRVAMAILRHSRIALTMEIYTQVPDKTTRDALKRLSDVLGGPEANGIGLAE